MFLLFNNQFWFSFYCPWSLGTPTII